MKLSESLEHLILCAVIKGHTNIKTVKRDELSRSGQFVYDGLYRLTKTKQAPFTAHTVLSAASDVAGGDSDLLRPFIAKVLDCGSGREAEDLLTAVREKQTLVDLVNLASEQMGSGLNRQAFLEKLQHGKSNTLKTASSFFQGSVRYKMPEGIPLTDLPRLQAATHGMYGIWALSGDSGVGKSTLTMELAVQVGRKLPVLFYDYENGQPVLLAHLSKAFNYNNKQIRKATEQIYFRDSIYTLDSDLSSIGKPCLIVVDSLQKIAVRGQDDRRSGIEKWVHRLEALKLLGHCVLMVSEKNRAFYGRTGQAGYKESGEIEYTVDVGVELLEVKDARGVVELSLNKNRNWPNTGYITTMTRTNDWWWTETGRSHR